MVGSMAGDTVSTAVGVMISDATCEGCSSATDAVVVGATDALYRHLASRTVPGLSNSDTPRPISTAKPQSAKPKIISEREENRILSTSSLFVPFSAESSPGQIHVPCIIANALAVVVRMHAVPALDASMLPACPASSATCRYISLRLEKIPHGFSWWVLQSTPVYRRRKGATAWRYAFTPSGHAPPALCYPAPQSAATPVVHRPHNHDVRPLVHGNNHLLWRPRPVKHHG